ncbi:MAG: HAD family hydrolase [Candidatus Hadarchaeales archaeon]
MSSQKIQAKAVIFDTDGTLVDTLPRFFVVFNELIAQEGGKTISWDEFLKRYIDDTLDDVILERLGPETDLHKFWLKFLERYREEDAGSKPINGSLETLKKLKEKGIPIAVITSCILPAQRLKLELDSLGLGEFVDTIVTGRDAIKDLNEKHHFSKEEIFRIAIEKLGVEPQECVIVGDYWNDIRDGKKVGAKTVAVLTGLMRRELLEKYGPDAVIKSIADLLEVVEFSK